ncbi:hypothetical protein GCM10025862_21290 [Arsenicicoccus piscis]|uniref:Uncharacterized protein n=1 Tax=Arsenicicoccus piscis TaxID=673954 RepID=A0ABQ6HR26_9MICO|nr:hypothetical protein GCM10025862_21290 [Arsenicicoccus piscis]
MPVEPQRLVGVPGDGGVGDPEAGGLDLARVVGRDDLLVDDAGRVGDQLRARRGELADVLADRLDERPHAVRGHPSACLAELLLDERRLVAVGLDGGALDHSGLGLLERVQHLFAAVAALVQDHEPDVVGRRGEVGQQLGLQVVRGLVQVVHDDGRRVAEQAGARVHPERA